MPHLVVNADDFGLTDGVTAGIVEAMDEGIVSSTTAMACAPGSIERIIPWLSRLQGRIGVHLQVTDGTPCLPPDAVPSLVGSGGTFPRSSRQLGTLDATEVEREWIAQVERLRAAGVIPTHLDTHHSVHRQHPTCMRAYLAVARRYDLPVRSGDRMITAYIRGRGVACADQCESSWSGESGVEGLVRVLRADLAGAGAARTVELMCHPGRVDADLRVRSHYVEQREAELRALCASQVRELLRELHVDLVPASALAPALSIPPEGGPRVP